MKKILFLSLLLGASTLQAKDVVVKSPNGKIQVTLSDQGGTLHYVTSLEGTELFNQQDMHLQLANKTLGKNTAISGAKKTENRGTITPVVPMKQHDIPDNWNGVTLQMKGGYKVEFRVMDNAVTYRYVINEKDSVNVMDETFNVNTPNDINVHYQPSEFRSSCEALYEHTPLKDWKQDGPKSTLPVVLSEPNRDLHLLICESNLRDYPGMFLRGTGSNGVTCTFPPVPLQWEPQSDRAMKFTKEADYVARIAGKRALPWRYVVIADSKGITEQTLTAELGGPCELDDTSWIKPGNVTWDWWNQRCIYGPDVNFTPGPNTDTYKYFIDFAHKFGVKYLIMDEGWAKSTLDPYTPNDNLKLQEVINYGKERGVGVILWLTWTCVNANMDKLFGELEKMGVVGAKIDFMDRQDQWMVNFYERTIREAAKHHIMVDFHGAYKPSGLEQRYPNLLAHEGVLGLENNGGCRPDNTLYVPFMRNAVGPVDFTPGPMVNTQPEHQNCEYPNYSAIGTRCYHMALFVILETGTQMLCDSPTTYYKNPECTQFIASVPPTWDETRALAADFGQYLIIAKRHGNKWYLGGICNSKEDKRHFTISLDFLSQGNHKMTLYRDGYNAGWQAMDYRCEERDVNSSSKVDIDMVRNGGWCAVIE